MTDANEMGESVMLELNEQFTSDEAEEEQECFSCHEEESSDPAIPPSLLSYFETSKTRAAVCEKLILEEFEASNCTEDMMVTSSEFSKDVVKLNEQIISETENEDNKTDGCHLQAPTETQTSFTHNVTACPDNEDGAGIDHYMENEKHLILEISKYETEQEKHHCEEMQKKEERQKREMNFQEELRKLMEAEKLHQKELELMEKRAQEKLEQELLLQQELLGNLQKRVEQERRMIEEEQKRKKDEEKRKMKEMQEERKREEKGKERKRKMKEEEEKTKIEEEQKRKSLEERKRLDQEEKKNMVKLRLQEEKKQEEHWKREEEVKRKREEEKNMREEEIRKKEEERNMEKIQFKEEEKRREEEEVEGKKQKEEKERKRREDEQTGMKEDEKNMLEVAGKKMIEEQKRKDYEKISIKEEKKRNNRDEEEKSREEAVRIATEHEVRMKQEQMERNEVQAKSEEEKVELKKKMVDEQSGRKDENTRRIDGKMELKGGEEKKKKDEDSMENQDMMRKEEKTKTKEEELIKEQNEEQEHRNTDEEIKLKPEIWGYKVHKADNTKMEHERKTKEKGQEEEKKIQEEDGIGKKEDRTRNKEDVRHYGKDVKENIQTEERRAKEEGKGIKKIQDAEKANGVISKNELQDKKRENSSKKSQNENTVRTEDSLTSQPRGNTTWTSSSADPLRSESTANPISSETGKQQDLDKNISQISIYKTNNQRDPAKPGTFCCSLPASLSQHTEQKRLSWMKDCIPWSKLSLQNKRKQKGSVRSRRGTRRVAEASGLPPLCPHTLLQSTGCKSLQEVTTVTLEDLPGCSLFTLAQCTQLQSLTLRRCGLKSLEGINRLQELWYIDLQENDISFVDCENMSSLRVLRLAHNKLTSIHGLNGVENLDVLDLSHNSITRIAGLESVRKLQRLSVDHNQLINTKGLRDVYTLLHLDCSHNHLANVEGLENSALLHTLNLRGNSLSEPPSLGNQVLLRELHLDDNSVSSLQGLTACWLPLMQHLSAAQNRITQLPSMSDFVSLENLDLRNNCLSELQNVCENLGGCQFLQEIYLTGNPLQQESGWRSTLQKAVPGLRAIDSQQTGSFFLPPAVQQVSLASGCFLTFCRAQLQQTHDLQQRHSRELSKASAPFEDVKNFCHHFTMTLKLAEDQRFAHEYGDTTVSDEHCAAGQTVPEKTLDSVIAEKLTDYPEMESTNKVPPVILSNDSMRCSYWNFEEIPGTQSHHGTFGPTEGPAASFSVEKPSVSSHQDLNLRNTAAVVIQQRWRKYKQKCGNINAPPITEKGGERGGDGGKPESRPCYINRSVVGKDNAATVIQAFWRGYALRRRLASALAAVTCPSAGEDDTFEEVDIDEFVFDEAALEERCGLMLSQDSPPRHYPVSQQALCLKPPGPCIDPSQDILPPPLVRSPKQAWVAGEHVDLAAQRISAESSNRSKSPASTSVLSGLSERSEKILEEWGFTDSRTALLMLRRARKMKSKKQPQKKHRDPSVRLALFRNCSYQLSPVEAQNRTARYNRNYVKVGGAEPGHQQAERTEQVKQDETQQWLHTQATWSHRHSESDHFLPEINSTVLNGGRVQLVANPAYADCLHHTSGLRANSSLAARPCKVNSYPRRTSSSDTRKEVPSPTRVTSAPSKKERISFRDNPVQLSGGWGGGKKRDKVHNRGL